MSELLKTSLKKTNYNQAKYLIIQSFASSMLIVFYSTKQSFLKSLLNPTHLITFGMTFVLIFILSWFLGKISAFLDRTVPWQTKTNTRYRLQFLLGVVLPAGISLLVVYLLFLKVMDVNIFQTAYLRRDFILLLVSIMGINLFHYYEFHKNSFRIPEGLFIRFPKSTNMDRENMEKLPDIQLETFTYTKIYTIEDKESTRKYKICGSETPILSNEIGMFFVKSDSSLRNKVFIKLINGQEELLLDYNSLSDVASQYQYLFIRIGRQWLVNRRTLDSYRKIDYRTYEVNLKISDTKPLVISSDNYKKLKSLLQIDD